MNWIIIAIIAVVTAAAAFVVWKFVIKRKKEDPNSPLNHFKTRMEQFKLQDHSPGGIILMGDSITECFELYKTFDKYPNRVRNRGSAGANTSIMQMATSLVINEKPDHIFLLIGTNDLGMKQSLGVEDRIMGIVKTLTAGLPDTTIDVVSLIPVNTNYDPNVISGRTNEAIKAINTNLIAKVSEYNHPKVWFLDIYPRLEKDGQLDPNMTSDGLHPNPYGSGTMASLYMSAYLTSLKKG